MVGAPSLEKALSRSQGRHGRSTATVATSTKPFVFAQLSAANIPDNGPWPAHLRSNAIGRPNSAKGPGFSQLMAIGACVCDRTRSSACAINGFFPSKAKALFDPKRRDAPPARMQTGISLDALMPSVCQCRSATQELSARCGPVRSLLQLLPVPHCWHCA